MTTRWARLGLVVGLAGAATLMADETAHLRTTTDANYRITYWTAEEGLPQNTVSDLLQTRDGYLWIGTRYGLVRYDGVRFTVFVSELSEVSPHALDIRGLAEDTRGRLWTHSSKELVCYHEGRFRGCDLTEAPFGGQIQSICRSRSGGLWVAKFKGFFHYADGKAGQSVSLDKDLEGKAGHIGSEITEIFEDSQKQVWVLTSHGIKRDKWRRFDPQDGTVKSPAEVFGEETGELDALAQGRDGRWWLGRQGELMCWENGKATKHDARSAWGSHRVLGLVEDDQGHLWARTEGPVQLFRFEAGKFTGYGRAQGLSGDDDLRCLLPDREGNLWVGSGSGGLNRLQPRQLVSMLSSSLTAKDEVYSVAPGREGTIWLALSYGVVRYEKGEFTVFTNSRAIGRTEFPRVRPVYEDRAGQLWFGLDGEGLQTLCDGTMTRVETPDLSGPSKRRINSLLEDRSGRLWAGTPRGLLERKNGRFRLWTTNDGLSDNHVFGLVEGADGSLWTGSDKGGVNEFKQGRFRSYGTREGLLSQTAWPLLAEADGSIWVGTPIGLNRIREGEIKSVTMRQGLFDNLAYCLLEDRRSNYWTFCNRGIWRVNKAALHAAADGRADRVLCVSYGEADGMTSTEGNGDQQPNASRMSNGEMWFPTTRGVVVLNPERMRDNDVRPSVVIEEVRADEQVLFKDRGIMEGDEGEPAATSAGSREPGGAVERRTSDREQAIRLRPGRARVIEFRYTANTFIDSEKARFRYWLEGHDEHWQEADTRRVAYYTNLRPGHYRFRVEACNHHGYWSRRPAEFAFFLAPRFHQTWMFYVCCSVAVLAAAGGWHHRRVSVLQRIQRLEHEQALQEERGRIAKDLHDDLGASLTGVALQVELARRELASGDPVSEHMRKAAQSIRGLVDRMREVVWTMNPQCDTLESFCVYVCQYSESFLGAAGLRCRLDVPEEMPPQPFSAEARHQLLLVVKEALNNAVKHAGASEVRLGLHLAKGEMTLSVQDNGCGLPEGRWPAGEQEAEAGEGAPGRGLDNMRRRVESMGGEYHLASVSGRGTRITVRVPIAGAGRSGSK